MSNIYKNTDNIRVCKQFTMSSWDVVCLLFSSCSYFPFCNATSSFCSFFIYNAMEIFLLFQKTKQKQKPTVFFFCKKKRKKEKKSKETNFSKLKHLLLCFSRTLFYNSSPLSSIYVIVFVSLILWNSNTISNMDDIKDHEDEEVFCCSALLLTSKNSWLLSLFFCPDLEKYVVSITFYSLIYILRNIFCRSISH